MNIVEDYKMNADEYSCHFLRLIKLLSGVTIPE